jgi:hypothetical protein
MDANYSLPLRDVHPALHRKRESTYVYQEITRQVHPMDEQGFVTYTLCWQLYGRTVLCAFKITIIIRTLEV